MYPLVDDDAMSTSWVEHNPVPSEEYSDGEAHEAVVEVSAFGNSLSDLTGDGVGGNDYAERMPDTETTVPAGRGGDGELRLGSQGLGLGHDPEGTFIARDHTGLGEAAQGVCDLGVRQLGAFLANEDVHLGCVYNLLGGQETVVEQDVHDDAQWVQQHVGMIRVTCSDVKETDAESSLPVPELADAAQVPAEESERLEPPPLPTHRRVPLYNPESQMVEQQDLPTHVWSGIGSTARIDDFRSPNDGAVVEIIGISHPYGTVRVREGLGGEEYDMHPAQLTILTQGLTPGVGAAPADVRRFYESIEAPENSMLQNLDELEIPFGRTSRRARRPHVCVDLDGTLLEDPPPGPWTGAFGAPIAGAADALGAMQDLGWFVEIWTARFSFDDDPVALEADIREVLEAAGIPFDSIATGPKPPADVFIDNKQMIQFEGDWDSVVRQVTQQPAEAGEESDVVAAFDIGEREMPEGGPGDLGMSPDPLLDKRASARRPEDLPPNMGVRIVPEGDGWEVRYESFDGERGFGSIVIQPVTWSRTYSDLYQVTWAAAAPGWGPLLYDVAMELATSKGDGLVSDRQGVSPAAQRVWRYYETRPDVTSEPASESTLPADRLRDVPALGKVYQSNGTPTIDVLEMLDLLIVD